MFAETAESSHLEKYFNPEYFTAARCCLVHINGGKKSAQKIFVMKVKSFEEFWDKVGGWMGTSWSCVWSQDAAMQPQGQGWSQMGRTSPGMSQRMENKHQPWSSLNGNLSSLHLKPPNTTAECVETAEL